MCPSSYHVPGTRYQVLEYSPQPHIIEFSNAMKFLGSALVALAVAASLPTYSEAFAVAPSKLSGLKATSFVPRRSALSATNKMPLSPPPQLSMVYSVAIVGATGAVGKEIRTCLEARNFPVSQLRIFGSARSAGTMVDTEAYGIVEVELFDVAKARECDVVFLAVSGEFALEHAEAIAAGDGGAVVIDNSVRYVIVHYTHIHIHILQSSVLVLVLYLLR